MAVRDAEFRLTVYEDSVGGTVLTPPSGAPHSDPFQVATLTGVTGFHPYLYYPKGREASLDPRSGKADTAKQTVKLLDDRVTAGGTDLERWVTAFVSNVGGRMAQMEISTDGGSSWSNYFTGRVTEPGLAGRPRMQLVIEGMNTELDADVFVGSPHSSISYAFMAPVWPIGLTESWAGADTKPRIPTTMNAGGLYSDRLEVDEAAVSGEMADRNIVTRALKDAMLSVAQRLNLLEANEPAPGLRVYADNITTGQSGQFYVTRGFFSGGLFAGGSGHIETERTEDGHHRVASVGIKELPSADPNHLTLPSDGDEVEIAIAADRPPSEEAPLLIDDVHPATLMEDILAGKFSHLDDDGSVRWSVPRDATAFSTLQGDSSFPDCRFVITEPMEAKEAITELLGEPFRIGRRWNGSGELVPVDIRVPDSTSGLTTIGNSDVDITGSAPKWRHSRRDAVTLVEVVHYIDELKELGSIRKDSTEYPALRPVQIESTEAPVRVLDVGDPSLGVQLHEIDARGIRVLTTEGTKEDQDAARRKLKQIKALVQEYRVPYGDGPEYIEVPLRRTFDAESLNVGESFILDVDEIPDPATSKRGGARVCMVTGLRKDRGNVILTAVDLYASSTAAAPTVGNPSAVSGSDGRFILEFDVTLNGSGDPARAEIAVTPTSTSSRPADAAKAWHYVERITGSANSTHTVQVEVPAGKRVWPRARSVPDDEAPSSWAYPSTTSADSDDLASVSGLSHSSIDGSSALASWTVGDAELDVVANLENTTHGTTVKQVALPPGSTEHEWRGLDQGDNYRTTVWHRGPSGESGPTTSATFTAGSSNQSAPQLAGFGILYGRNFQVGAESGGDQETGFVVFLMPRDSSLPVELEVAPDDGSGSPDTASSETLVVAPGTREYTVHRPADGESRFARARHTESGSDPSEWTAWHEAVPRRLPALMPQFPEEPLVAADVWLNSDGNAQIDLDGSLQVGSYRYEIQTGSYADPDSSSTLLVADAQGDADVTDALSVPKDENAFLSVDVYLSEDGTGTAIASVRDSTRRQGPSDAVDAQPEARLRQDSELPREVVADLYVESGNDVADPDLRYRYKVGRDDDFGGWTSIADSDDGTWLDREITVRRPYQHPRMLVVEVQDQTPASSPSTKAVLPISAVWEGQDYGGSGHERRERAGTRGGMIPAKAATLHELRSRDGAEQVYDPLAQAFRKSEFRDENDNTLLHRQGYVGSDLARESGGPSMRRSFAKPQATDPDDLDGVPDSAAWHRTDAGYQDASGRPNTLRDSAAGVDKPGDRVFDTAREDADDVDDGTSRRTAATSHTDGSGRPTTIRDTADARDKSGDDLFDHTFEDADVISDGGSFGTVAVSHTDGSKRPDRVRDTAAGVDKVGDDLFDHTREDADDVSRGGSRAVVNTGYLDGSERPDTVRDGSAGVDKSGGDIFDTTRETADDVSDGASRRTAATSHTDASGRPTTVRDSSRSRDIAGGDVLDTAADDVSRVKRKKTSGSVDQALQHLSDLGSAEEKMRVGGDAGDPASQVRQLAAHASEGLAREQAQRSGLGGQAPGGEQVLGDVKSRDGSKTLLDGVGEKVGTALKYQSGNGVDSLEPAEAGATTDPAVIELFQVVDFSFSGCPGSLDIEMEWIVGNWDSNKFTITLEFWADFDADSVYGQKDSDGSPVQDGDITSDVEHYTWTGIPYDDDGACPNRNSYVKMIITRDSTGETVAVAQSDNIRFGAYSCFDNACATGE